MRLKIFLALSLLSLQLSCEQTDCCAPLDLDNLAGQYLVYEYGYSPGDRYIVEDVPAQPGQTLNFGPFGGFSSNYEGLTIYQYYRVYEHPTEGRIVALYEEMPPAADEVDLAFLQHSYIVQQQEENLKLIYRYCREGCHIGVRKIK